jgi:tetratricopeptide (TPR) repeat protein
VTATRYVAAALLHALVVLAPPPARGEVGGPLALAIEGCAGLDTGAVQRVLMAELGVRVVERGGAQAVEARVRCLPGFARVAVEAARDRSMVRLVDLAREAPAARARVLALAIVEALETEAAEPAGAGGIATPPAPTPRAARASNPALVAAVSGPRRAGPPSADAARCVPREVYEAVLECPAGAAPDVTPGAPRPGGGVSVAHRAGRTEDAPAARPGPGLPERVGDRSGAHGQTEPRPQPLAILRQEVSLSRRLVDRTDPESSHWSTRVLRLAAGLVALSDALEAEASRLDEPIAGAARAAGEAAAIRDEAIQRYTLWAERAVAAEPDRRWVLDVLGSLFEAQAEHHGRLARAGGDARERERERLNRDRARRVYETLLDRYPAGGRGEDASTLRALLFFARDASDRGDLEAALGHYARLGRSGHPVLSPLGHYRAAWTQVALGRDREALAAFTSAIRAAAAHPDDRDAAAIARQARLELVGPYSRATAAAPPRQVWRAFRRLGGDDPVAAEMVERLARQHADQGQWSEAAGLYRSLVEEDGAAAARCVHQARAAEAASHTPAEARAQAVELRRAAGLMREVAGTGQRAGPASASASECRRAVAGLLIDTATRWHAEAVGPAPGQGTNDAEALRLAEELYRLALDALPDLDDLALEGWDEASRPTTYRVSYWLADLLYARGEWGECGPAYDRVVDLDPRPGAELLEEAAYGAVVCYDRLLEAGARSEPGEDPAGASDGGEGGAARRELTPAERAALGAYSRYLCFVGDSEDLTRVSYRRAAVHRRASQLEEAAILFREVAYGAPSDELGQLAALQYVEALAAVGQRDPGRFQVCRGEMERAVDDFLGDERVTANAEAAAALARTRCGILWSRAEELAARGEPGACADLYLEIWDRWREPCREIGGHGLDEVLHNAAACLEADARIGHAIKVRRTLIEEFGEGSRRAGAQGEPGAGTKGSPLAVRALREIGGAYQATAYFGRAAEAYEAYAARYPAEPDARDALHDATLFRIALGQPEKALGDARLFEKSYGRAHGAETATVLLAVGAVFLDRAQWREAGEHFRKMLAGYGRGASPDVAIRARVGLGSALWRQGGASRREALDSFERALAVADRGAPSAGAKTPEPLEARLARYRSMLGGAEAPRLGLMVDAVAEARFHEAEAAYERFAAIAAPPFRPKASLPPAVRRWWMEARGRDTARSVERAFASMSAAERREWIDIVQVEHWAATSLGPWLDRRGAAQAAAMELYGRTAAEGVPGWGIAAAKRVGDMYRETMQALVDAPLPEDLEERRGELIAQYRGSAVAAYEACLRESTRSQWFSEWSRGCERQLNALVPRDFPLADEIRAEPVHSPSPLAEPGLVRSLPPPPARPPATSAAGRERGRPVAPGRDL